MSTEIDKVAKEIESKFERAKHEVLALLHSIEAPPVEEIAPVIPGVEPLVPTPMVALHLGISETQVRTLEKQGKLPSYRPGGRLVFKISECEEAVRTRPSLKKAS